jgi:hypothetical protein
LRREERKESCGWVMSVKFVELVPRANMPNMKDLSAIPATIWCSREGP